MTTELEITVTIDDPVHESMYEELSASETPVESILGENLGPQTEQLLYQLYQRARTDAGDSDQSE